MPLRTRSMPKTCSSFAWLRTNRVTSCWGLSNALSATHIPTEPVEPSNKSFMTHTHSVVRPSKGLFVNTGKGNSLSCGDEHRQWWRNLTECSNKISFKSVDFFLDMTKYDSRLGNPKKWSDHLCRRSLAWVLLHKSLTSSTLNVTKAPITSSRLQFRSMIHLLSKSMQQLKQSGAISKEQADNNEDEAKSKTIQETQNKSWKQTAIARMIWPWLSSL